MEEKTVNMDTVEMTVDLKEVQRVGGGAGTNDYETLNNKPQINGIELVGNKTTEELGIVDGKDGKDGATFIPSVSEDGILSWSNNQDLPNPEEVNIKGPQGEVGPAGQDGATGPQGEQGPQGEPGVGVPTGGTMGQVLSKNSDNDYDTTWIDVSSGSGTGIVELIGTEDEPIDFINGMQDEGIYLISGKYFMRSASTLSEFASPVLCFITKYMITVGSDKTVARFIFDFNGGPSIQLGYVTKGSTSTYWKGYALSPVSSFNGNGNGFDAVSTYLFKQYTGMNSSNYIKNLQTTDKTSLVGAINELKAEIDALKG